MNQTRMLLILAWLMVATMLWMAWGKEQSPPAAPATATVGATSGQVAAVPGVDATGNPGVPGMSPLPAQ